MFVVLEGPDAAGKLTQAKRLQERLERLGQEVVLFSFPRYQTPLGKAIQQHLFRQIAVVNIDGYGGPSEDTVTPAPSNAMIFQCMMVADKYDAAPAITQAIKRDAFVISDRWWQSAYCYGAADGLPHDWLYRAHQQLPQADLNLYLEVAPAETLRRRPQPRDRFEQDQAKQDCVRGNYRALWHSGHYVGRPPPGWYVIDGEGSQEDVHDRIWLRVIAEQERRMRP